MRYNGRMRLFVGIDLPDAIDEHLALVGGGIPRARWETTDKFHITLRFIGEVDGGTKRHLEDALMQVSGAPFEVSLAGVGHFPPSGKPRVLWAGIDGSDPLHELHGRVERTLEAAGLERSSRKYSPHVTLARLRDPPRNKVVEFMQHHALLRTMPFMVDAFQLYSSVLSPRGSKYRIEHHYPLQE